MFYIDTHYKWLIVFILLHCFATPAFSFTKLDINGKPLDDSVQDWEMIRDDTTGLIWEAKQAHDYEVNYNNIHDADNIYTWYDSNPDTNGGFEGYPGNNTDTEDFINTMNRTRFGGFSDWRMPTQDELRSILNLENSNPAVDTNYFANTSESYYWTANTVADDFQAAWKVDFSTGEDMTHDKSGEYHVRAVRKGALVAGSLQFETSSYHTGEADGNVTVTVSRTGGSAGIVSVNYSVNSNLFTAIEGTDFNFQDTDHTLTWEDGDTTDKSFNIIVLDDNIVEREEFVTINLINSTNGATIGTPSNTTLLITDNDQELLPAGILQFSSSSYQAAEADGIITVTVSRTDGGSGAVSVDYTVNLAETTATEGSDFNFQDTDHTLTWEDGDATDKSFVIAIIDNRIVEEDEFIVINLINPTNRAVIGSSSATRISIEDNDGRKINDITDVKDIIDQIETENDAADITDRLNNDIELIKESMPEETSSEPLSEELVNAINTTIENTGNIIRISSGLLQEGNMSVDQALKTVVLLDDAIALGASAAKSDGKISIQKVADGMESVETVITESINKGATAVQMNSSSDNINNILDNMPDIMNAVVTTADVVNILTPLRTLTGGGIKSSLKGNANPAQIVDSIGATVTKGLQDAIDTNIILNTGKIIKSAGSVVNYSIEVLRTNTENKTAIQNTLAQLQVELGEMIDQTALNIKDKPVRSKSFALASTGNGLATDNNISDGVRSATDSDRAGEIFIKEDFATLMIQVSGLTTSMIRMKSVLTSKLFVSMQKLSLETMKNILPDFISGSIRKTLRSDSDIQMLLKYYPQFLNEVINIASVNLTPGMLISSADISQILDKNPSFTSAEKSVLSRGLPELPSFTQDIIKSGSTELSIVELFRKAIQAAFPSITVEVNSANGIDLMIMLQEASIGFKMPVYIQDARVVSSLIPDGFYLLPEGVLILVQNSIAGIMSPAPLDSVDTLLSVDSLLSLNDLFGFNTKKTDVKITNSGNLDLTLQDGRRFYGAFGYGATTKGDGSFNAGTSSFELNGNDPASEAYSVLVIYNDGSTQQLTPSISALEQLVQVFDALAPQNYSIDWSTGILTIFDIRFKPSYFLEAIVTENDKIWFNDNKSNYGIEDIDGIAWEVDDYNADGLIDLKMWTIDGKQIIYTAVE